MRQNISKYMPVSVSIALMWAVCVSCGGSDKNSTTATADTTAVSQSIDEVDDDETKEPEEIKVDIPVAVNLGHYVEEPDDIVPQYNVVAENDRALRIETNSAYYNKYMSDKRFEVPVVACYDKYEYPENLNLELDVVNNTDTRLSISDLDVVVEKSRPDSIPYISIYTTESPGFTLYFVNGSDFDWGGFDFSYSIMKDGELFDGNYDNKVHVPYFKDYQSINFLPDMRVMGFDPEGLIDSIKEFNIREGHTNIDPWDEEGKYLTFSAIGSDDVAGVKGKLKPFGLKPVFENFFVGRAILYGSIKFDNSNIRRDFVAEISLTTGGGFGDYAGEDDTFDIELPATGRNYSKRLPYTTVIEPYGSEMIKLKITSPISSHHRFYIDIVNDNGLVIRSKKIRFHNYKPRFSR